MAKGGTIWQSMRYSPFKRTGTGKSYTPKIGDTASKTHLKNLKDGYKSK